MKIALASDHAGLEYKIKIKEYLENNGYTVEDFGTYTKESCDYPDFVKAAAKSLAEGKSDKAIGVCGSGIGVSIAANKVKGVRAALVVNKELAKLSRQHNNANFLSIGQNFVKENDLLEIVDTWLNTEFEGGRHQKRVDKLD